MKPEKKLEKKNENKNTNKQQTTNELMVHISKVNEKKSV